MSFVFEKKKFPLASVASYFQSNTESYEYGLFEFLSSRKYDVSQATMTLSKNENNKK